MDDRIEKPGYAALRQYRESRSGADYFITSNLAERGGGLDSPVLTKAVLQQCREIEAEGLWSVRTAVVMPDHIHLLIGLGSQTTLAVGMRLLKGRLTPALRHHGLKWQEGFYEHQIRESEDLLPIFLYIYLNPYRADLVPVDQIWPGYYCCLEDWKWFEGLTRESMPQPEWLR
jgi:putative transposase